MNDELQRDDDRLMEPEDTTPQPLEVEDEWSAKYDVPSQAPGFEGATPQALARALVSPLETSKRGE